MRNGHDRAVDVPQDERHRREDDLGDEHRHRGRRLDVAGAREEDVPERVHARRRESERECRGRHARTLRCAPDADTRDRLRLQRDALGRRARPLRDLHPALRRARQAALGAGVLRPARRPLRPGDRPHVARARPSRRRRGRRGAGRPLPGGRRGRLDGATSTCARQCATRPTRVPLAICSGAARAEIEPVVEAAGLASCFRAIVSSDDVVDGKPHPEGYVRALELLGADPADAARLRGHRGRRRVRARCRRRARARDEDDARAAPARGGRRADRPHRRRRHAPMLVIAHRGAWRGLAENTLPAFERAIELGADYVELDVLARHGRHPRSARARRALPHARRGGRAVPRPHRAHGGGEATARRRRRPCARRSSPTTTCSSLSAAPRSCRRAPSAPACARCSTSASASPSAARATRGRPASPTCGVTRRGVAAALALGLEPLVYTVNEPARMRELADAGVAGVFTDRPDLALRESRAAARREIEQARLLHRERRVDLRARRQRRRPRRRHVRDEARAAAVDAQARDRPEERVREHLAADDVRTAAVRRPRPRPSPAG